MEAPDRGWCGAVALAILAVTAGCLGATTPAGSGDQETTSTLAGPTTALPPDVGTTATVVRVVDGDTVVVELPNGTEEKVRMIGVDTPEVYAETDPAKFDVPDTQAGRSCLDRWGERASEYAKRHLDGRTVRLVYDDALPRRGYYGRLLAYVYVGDRSFNHALIASGHARVFESDFVRRADYERTQRRVRENRTGLWECLDAGSGAATTTGGSGLVLAEMVADAPGDDGEFPNGEYVVFENRGDDPLDLSGWTVRDAAGHEYRFPEGTTLDPGGRVVLYTGSGTDAPGKLYWGQSSAVWNNGGDTVVVTDATGTVVLRESY